MKAPLQRYGIAIVVSAIVLAVYAPTLTFGRVQLDDDWLWADDSPLRHMDSEALHNVFFELDARARHPLGTEYLPIRDLVVALDMAIWGTNEQGPHVTQLLLFCLTVVALGTLLLRIGASQRVAWAATLLWAIHPLHVESIAWLSERKGVLSALFVVACGHAWTRYRSGHSRCWLLAASVASVAAVWSKAPAMFGVVAFAAVDLLLLPRDPRRWRVIAVVAAATLVAAIPVVLVAKQARVIGDGDELVGGSVASALGSQGHYWEGVVLARAPSVAYPIQTDGPTYLELGLGVAAIVASIALAWRWRGHRNGRCVYAVLVWAWVWFLPISHLITPLHIAVADRFVYVWLLAPCLAVSLILDAIPKRVATAILAAIVCVLGIAAIRAEGAWVTSVELFEKAVASNPRDRVAHENLAIALQREGRTEDAIVALDRGLSASPDEPHLLSRRATLLFDEGRTADALATSAKAASSDAASAMWTHAVLLERAKRPAEALPWAERAAHRHPELVHYVRTNAAILLELGRTEEALPMLRAVTNLQPQSAHDRVILAGALRRLGRTAEAEVQLLLARRAR